MSLFELLQQSKTYRDAMNQILKEIKIDVSDPKSFISFIENIKTGQKTIISFYDYEIKPNNGPQGLDPPLHIIYKIYSKVFKRILIDEGSDINIMSISTYQKFNLPLSYISSPYLQIKAFNNVLCSTIGSIVLRITIGSKIIQT